MGGEFSLGFVTDRIVSFPNLDEKFTEHFQIDIFLW